MAETIHHVDVVAVAATGAELFSSGATDRPFFYRSAIKPFQAVAGRRLGLELPGERLALACASHGGYPVHIAIVEEILQRHGMGTDQLKCPAAWPLAPGARDGVVAGGHRAPRPVYHPCSGKHSGWLAACRVGGLDPSSYLDPEHPLQAMIVDIVHEVTGCDPAPIGMDGCGGPTMRGDVRSLARAYSRLTSDAEMRPIADAMTAYGALVADNVRCEGRVGSAWGGPVKGGAEGVFAASRHGAAIVAKSWDGGMDIAVAAVLEVADRIGMLPGDAAEWLDECRRPPVLGGGHVVGHLTLVDAD